MNALKEKQDVTIETKQNDKKREVIWDIVKGIGIISIVIGHVTPYLSTLYKFVYMYHLVIFYFVATYFFNEKKYGDKPFACVGQRFKGVWTKFLFYNTILVLLHNFFVKQHFYSPATPMYEEFKSFLGPILNAMTFMSSELFAGALWFVPTIILAMGLFAGSVYIARRYGQFICSKFKINTLNKQKYIKYGIILLVTSLWGVLGVYLNKNAISLNYHIHTVFLVIPICTMGYFCKEYIEKIRKANKLYITIPTCIITAGFLVYIIIKEQMQIELSKEMIINGYMFYIVSFIGICFCLSLASIIEKIPVLNQLVELCGKHSFSIMALHFACAKGVDVLYAKMIGEINPEVISTWVVTYPEKLWIIYTIIGCIIPLLFSMGIEFIKNVINNKVNQSQINEVK